LNLNPRRDTHKRKELSKKLLPKDHIVSVSLIRAVQNKELWGTGSSSLLV
jgi:hypothetical protein